MSSCCLFPKLDDEDEEEVVDDENNGETSQIDETEPGTDEEQP